MSEVSEDTEVLYPKRPEVIVDGQPVEHKEPISGKALEVYEYLADHPGFHGVRDIQRALDYSSPSVVYYHLSKLIDLQYIIQDDNSKYSATKEAVDLGNIGSHIRFMSYWIPRSLLYAIPLLSMILLGTVYVIFDVSTALVWYLSFAPILLILAILLLKDSIHFSRKLSNNTDTV